MSEDLESIVKIEEWGFDKLLKAVEDKIKEGYTLVLDNNEHYPQSFFSGMYLVYVKPPKEKKQNNKPKAKDAE